jgi:hypothetical protein
MRVKKLLKITGITVASMVILLLLLMAAFVYNPFEASLPAMKDVVPRNVDFCLRKAKLLGDFEGQEDGFPVIPALKDLFNREAWQQVLSGPAAASLGIQGVGRGLEEARRTFQELRSNHIHLVRDVIGEEVLLAGRFVSRDQSRWCAYLSVSWRIRFAYGLLQYGFVQERLRQNGIALQKVGDAPLLYKIRLRGSPQDLFVLRDRNCLIVSNDQKLAEDSFRCAVGGADAPEPLARSSHYIDGVDNAIKAWQKRTEVPDPNTLEVFLRPGQLLPLMPELRQWPSPKAEDRNERIMASFLNINSWRFLSGSLIFEPNSLSVLLDLEVDNTQHTEFLKDFFKTERDDRSKWMDDFIGMVPANAVAAASLRMHAGGFLHEMYEQALDAAEKEVLNDTLRQTAVYKSVSNLIDKVKLSFLPRVGIVFSKNERDAKLREWFPVQEETAMPQWVWVFWVWPGREQPLQEFVNTLKKHLGAFGFTNAYQLKLLRGSSADVAYEFANPLIPGTGSLAVCTYGVGAGRGQAQYFFVGNSGNLIQRMINARLDPRASLRNEPDYKVNFEPELPNAVNGLVWVSGRQIKEVLQALLAERQITGDRPPPVWDVANRPVAERTVFHQKYRQFHSPAGIPRSLRQRFDEEVTKELDQMWEKRKADYSAEGRAKMEQWIHLAEAVRSFYAQVILDPHSLQLAGRALATEYR